MEGHLRSVVEMIEGGRSCLDIAQQLHAVEKAIGQAKNTLIQDHLDNCLEEAAGALPREQRIDEAAAPAQLLFEWRERGGPPVVQPTRKGFGSELLERTLAFELKGQTMMFFNAAGFVCQIAIPLTKRSFHTPSMDG